MASKVLDGIRVLDLGSHLSGPMVGLIMRGMGAEVIKIEPCGGGERSRRNPPDITALPGHVDAPPGTGLPFYARNRGKQSVCLNLRDPAGKEVLLDLCRHSDILVENFRPDVMDRLGLGYDTLSAANERLIMCSLSGFGRAGEKSKWLTLDPVIQAASGLMHHTGSMESGPLRSATTVADMSAGLYATIGVLGVLHERERTGHGRWIQVSMLEVMASLLWDEPWQAYAADGVPPRSGNHLPRACPWNTFLTADGYVMIGVAREDHWHNLVDHLGTELFLSLRTADTRGRLARRHAIEAELADWCRTRTSAAATEELQGCGVPAAPVLSAIDARAYFADYLTNIIPVSDGDGAPYTWDIPLTFSGHRMASLNGLPLAPPGGDSQSVLRDTLRYSDQLIAELEAAGVIETAAPLLAEPEKRPSAGAPA
jgi:CoA:oxalate CoA-transferase